jgi:hypothetical protein
MDVVVAILAKDKAYCLDFYLRCLLNQTFSKKRTHLYIRTNDNNDSTAEKLDRFVSKYASDYASVFYSKESISEEIKSFSEHEWNKKRFDILARIRQDSVDHAKQLNSHYFVVDCDNFIVPTTLQSMYDSRHLGVVAPMLKKSNSEYYANYHYAVDSDGYFENSDMYTNIVVRSVIGKIEVAVVHCTYFINNSLLDLVNYSDDTGRHEYVVFSECLRNNFVPQYIDNTKYYGFLYLGDPVGFRKKVMNEWSSEIKSQFKLF